MKNKINRQHTVEILFPLIFILVFCFCVMILILGGTAFYQKTADGLEENYTIRTAVPYIQEKCREHEQAGYGGMIEEEFGQVFWLGKKTGSLEFATYIYCKDGYLQELFCKKTENPSYEAGQKLVRLDDLKISPAGDKIFAFHLDQDGKEEVFYCLVNPGESEVAK